MDRVEGERTFRASIRDVLGIVLVAVVVIAVFHLVRYVLDPAEGVRVRVGWIVGIGTMATLGYRSIRFIHVSPAGLRSATGQPIAWRAISKVAGGSGLFGYVIVQSEGQTMRIAPSIASNPEFHGAVREHSAPDNLLRRNLDDRQRRRATN